MATRDEVLAQMFIVIWDNGNHACGELPDTYPTYEAADAAGREWLAEVTAEWGPPGEFQDAPSYEVMDANEKPDGVEGWPMATRDEVLNAYAPRVLSYIEYIVALSSDEVDWCWESFASTRENMVQLLKDIDDACNRPRETD